MQAVSRWPPAEPDLKTILRDHPRPLDALSRAEVPAIVLRGVYPQAACEKLFQRLIERDLLYDPDQPPPPKFVEASIPEGHYREGRDQRPTSDSHPRSSASARPVRIDIGTSLGYRGNDPPSFFAHAAQTHRLFESLFEGMADPVKLIYHALLALSLGKQVQTAHEPDGRKYGPAIIRAHYGGYAYKPHFDSVRLREKRTEFAAYRFDHQFAGVLVLRNSERGDETAQCVLHRCLWTREIQSHLDAETFHDYARENGIENVRVCLDMGDLYFFNPHCIHEVPGIEGHQPRVVLATFIGYSTERDEIFVWS